MDDFLPKGYEPPKSTWNYMKIVDWDNKFRILSNAIVWWEDWEVSSDWTRKPVRYTYDKKPETSFDPEKPVKHFWAFIVYNYSDKNIQILEITQKSIQSAITSLYLNEDWGDPKWYDIKINRSWKELKTEYVITPSPSKPLNPEIIKDFESKKINLSALFEWKDPFNSDTNDLKSKLVESINIEDIPF